MTLREYLKYLNDLAKNMPHLLDVELIYASDEEGNSYHKVYKYPTIGEFNNTTGENIFYPNAMSHEVNAILIN